MKGKVQAKHFNVPMPKWLWAVYILRQYIYWGPFAKI